MGQIYDVLVTFALSGYLSIFADGYRSSEHVGMLNTALSSLADVAGESDGFGCGTDVLVLGATCTLVCSLKNSPEVEPRFDSRREIVSRTYSVLCDTISFYMHSFFRYLLRVFDFLLLEQ